MNRRLLLHTGFWLAYLLLTGFLSGRYDLRFQVAYMSESAQLPAKMGAVYLALHWVGRPPASGRLAGLLLRIAAAVAAATLVNRVIMYHALFPAFFAGEYTMEFWSLDRILYTAIDVSTVVAVAVALKLVRHRTAMREREQRVAQEKLQSELLFLRSQTNPHFLFNTLNNIYALARRESPRVAALVMQLSKLLRFMLYECSRPLIPLEHETRVIRDYIELEKLRYGENYLQAVFNEEADNPQQDVAPLLLLPFVENAFKHGAGESRAGAGIDIDLRLEKGVLDFSVSNSVAEEPGEEGSPSQGLGLSNVRRQLELLYPNAHRLEIDRQPGRFNIRLTIQLDGYETSAMPDRRG
jgi:two-component system, LytTR family, sensor kinase